jgi:GT2 family glycosyltransferase
MKPAGWVVRSVVRAWADEGEPTPLASIIVVAFNKMELTQQCLRNIAETTDTPYEIVVVDNASSDGTGAWLRSLALPELTVVESGENLGFGRGCNLGAERARGELFVFLNNDTLLCPGWLGRLAHALRAHRGLGLVGPMTNVASNAQRLAPEHSTLPEDHPAVAQRLCREHAGEVEIVRRLIGFCMVVPRSVWREVGPFDPRFGIGHYEDDDLSVRVERAGYKAAVARDVYVHHFASQSFRAAGVDVFSNQFDKAFVFYKKWGNEYLDWPDLRSSLQGSLHVVAPFDGGPVPEWRPGDPAYLLTCVRTGAPEAGDGALEALHRSSRIFGYVAARGARALGEALNVGVASHEAWGHLLLERMPDREALARLARHCREAYAGGVRAIVFERDGSPVAYWASRESWEAAGPLDNRGRRFAALVSAHAAASTACGLRCLDVDYADPARASLREPRARGAGRSLWARGRRMAQEGWVSLVRSVGRWSTPPRATSAARGDVVNITMLSYHRLSFTRQAVEAVRERTRGQPYRLVVVDNASGPETVAWLKDAKRRGWIDVLILNGSNLGVARAANLGWRALETSHYVKLDNDIVVEKPDWLADLVAVGEGIPDAGMVGYNFESVSYPLRDVEGHRVRPRAVHLGGACVLVTRRAHERVGFWCEDYFPYSEEDFDMGYRLTLAGFRHYYLEDEHVGVHLPRGKATGLDAWRSLDDEDDPAYRGFKDAARRRHTGVLSTRWLNQQLYRRGLKSLYVTPR